MREFLANVGVFRLGYINENFLGPPARIGSNAYDQGLLRSVYLHPRLMVVSMIAERSARPTNAERNVSSRTTYCAGAAVPTPNFERRKRRILLWEILLFVFL